jgi:hypothetical protein
MAGRPGRSGGHNKLSVEEHLLRGTYNVTRHGPRPAALTVAARSKPGAVPEYVVIGLSGRGLAFVEATWNAYGDWTPQSLELLREAGFLLTQIEALRGQKGERAAQRLLLSALSALRLED